ncbi:MAG: phosphoglucosamine mutase [Flavobacteriales bacterium]
MTLIKSISGIRGTIGGNISDNLTPIDVVKFTSAYAQWIKNTSGKSNITIVIGRDARLSGEMVSNLVSGTLIGMGVKVIDLGLSTTPTVEIAVPMEKADGGIIITASHNPKQWNALKLLNEQGEFISGEQGEELIRIADNDDYSYSQVDDLGNYSKDDSYLQKHIDSVLDLKLVDKEAIKNAGFKVVVDAVNSTGGIFIPALLKQLGVEVVELYCEPTGHFPHNPEPLAENLTEISKLVTEQKADLGIVVDPDVDRLAFVCNDGSMFGEEYTLVAVADYVTKNTPGNTVSNLSSTRALNDVTVKNGGQYFASAVGEVNVVEKMKAENAVIGGEGNGGIIYPESHYGRDALVGVGLFLTHLAKEKITSKEMRNALPNYEMSKNKIQLTPQINVDEVLVKMKEKYANERVNDIDGVKIDFENEWVHLRKSNTEPIIRVYSESETEDGATAIANQIINDIHEIINK